jgi:peptidoglycan L-alanyl-D-glutamate endopeptidase CwlK
MPQFSSKSLEKLKNCHKKLQLICNKIIKYYDFTILEGFRSQQLQNKYFTEKKTQLCWPESKHNTLPSCAIDIAPWPINWQDRASFYFLSGLVLATAKEHNINLRWGGDWNQNMNFSDENFSDLVHFELINR